jgi:purine-nucleoside phosphorylase
MLRDDGLAAATAVRARRDAPYRLGIVLGSGLGPLADAVEDAVAIPYGELPGMPVSKVSAHAGRLVAGRLEGVEVLVFSGRSHFYETGDAAIMRNAVGMLKHLGCEGVILTNAAGSLHAEMGPGSLMMLDDHINFSGGNPLIGEESDARFVGMTTAYDLGWRAAFERQAEAAGIPLSRGVYMWFSGPSFETPAEIRMARILGADAVGMSTVPEAILARFFDLKVAAFSNITNLGAGMTGAELSHQETKDMAPLGAKKLEVLIRRFLKELAG